jgi:hypothetical protein
MKSNKDLWNLFTATEEYNSTVKDKYGRFPYYLSKNRSVFQPLVSEYLLKNGLQIHYPNNKKFAICLTHDIDQIYDFNYLKTLKRHSINAARDLLSFNFNSLKSTLTSIAKKEIKSKQRSVIKTLNPSWHIRRTLELDRKYNAKSSFYFLSLSPDEKDYHYELSDIKDLFEEIEYNKCEIGLHGGHLAYNNFSKMKEEKERLELTFGKKIYGYRNHFLRFETPTTWEYLDRLNFKYDTTFGYADCSGFRNGMCHPFQPYSNNQNTFLNIIELPLIVMDNTLSHYMNLSEEEIFKVCKNIIDTVEHNNGVLTFLWHNTMMDGMHGRLYNAFLKYACEKNAWITSANEIVDWWKENNFLEESRNILERLKN